MTKHTNAAGQVTVFEYDPIYNHCTSMTDCNHRKTLYEQDPLGMTMTTHHPDGTKSCQAIRWGHGGFYQWEKKTGQPTKVTDHALTGETIRQLNYSINGDIVKTTFEYDNFGRLKEEILPSTAGQPQQSTSYEYDEHHRVKRVNHTDGSAEVLNYDANRSSVSFLTPSGSQQTESKTFNAMGWVVRSTDANGVSVIYDYYPDGKPRCTQIEGVDDTKIQLCYDANGNRASIYDPNYGFATEVHNAYGELTRSVSPDFVTTDYTYDLLGNKTRRVETSNNSGQQTITEWLYDSTEGSQGLLLSITSDNQSISYDYDEQLRLKAVSENQSGINYRTLYSYDEASRMASMTYPSGYTVHYRYTAEGYLRDITDDNAAMLWKANATNALGVPTKVSTGNGWVTEYSYGTNNNKLKSIKTCSETEVIQDYCYEYDEFSNMTRRIDQRHGIDELFVYDNLNRLIKATDEKGESLFSYDPLGRMLSKTRAGQTVFDNADYSGPMPHAIKSAQTQQGVFPEDRMQIEYTDFGKVASITQGANHISYRYGYDHQRIQSTEDVNGIILEKAYVNSCEFIIPSEGSPIIRTFLSCPTGVFAVAETRDDSTRLHYVHKDHLGSWTLISDSEGNIEQENRFDAWGYCENNDELLFGRGFTGHEHIKGMNLINMNGRLYDPLTSSMISPDPYVQMPDFSQNFNRYAYCLNNPLTYVDPDGNSFIDAVILFYILFCTDAGYEIQKEFLPIAFHLDIHISNQQLGVGIDASIGIPKKIPLSVRLHGGLSYYWNYFDNSYQGWEFRTGAEICAANIFGVSGTAYYFGGKKQVTNTIYIGKSFWKIDYENDFMFGIADEILGLPSADNGDRYRTCAAKIRFGLYSVGLNLFTGDPGLSRDDRRTYIDPSNDRETYTIGANGEDPDKYRAGVLYVGLGPLKVGVNSEQVRHVLQNRFAHDFLCQKDSPYFKVLDRPTQGYFYFGSGTGGSLW